jgi:hypothetical protein
VHTPVVIQKRGYGSPGWGFCNRLEILSTLIQFWHFAGLKPRLKTKSVVSMFKASEFINGLSSKTAVALAPDRA